MLIQFDQFCIELAQMPVWMLMKHIPTAVFVFCFGACVGSFLNVVIYRLPAGMSVVSPPSRCPTCGARLKFFRENLPILGWLMVKGKCRYCGVKISSQYMLVEALMGLVFVGMYGLLYVVSPLTVWWGGIGGFWWHSNGFLPTMPAFFTLVFLMAGLVAMTVIDARTFTIPIQIPLFVTVVAFLAYPVQGLMPLRMTMEEPWVIPAGMSWLSFAMVMGGMLGILGATMLLRLGVMKYSFADYHEYVKEDETLGDYPHGRREMGVELKFLLPCFLGLAVGWGVGRFLPGSAPPVWVQGLGGSVLGYLVGGGLVWAVRILGTLGFGREAMGMGDVHLLAAVGAVLGWFDPILIFFLAPFSGLFWHVLSKGLSSIFSSERRELPYGPHLAMATIAVILMRPGVEMVWVALFQQIPMPSPGILP